MAGYKVVISAPLPDLPTELQASKLSDSLTGAALHAAAAL
jgi:hypothetical protein